jgi:tetratricopeptide (TPR) repeat protein
MKIFQAALDNPTHPCPNPLLVRMRVAELAEQVNDLTTMEKMLHAILMICLPRSAALDDASQHVGAAVTTVQEALQDVVPIVMSDDEDDEENEDQAGSAPTAAASASTSAHPEGSASEVQSQDPIIGLQAAVKLAGLAVSQGRYELVNALFDTVQAFVADHPAVVPAGAQPLELTTYAGIAALHLGNLETALNRWQLLWQVPTASGPLVHCYAMVAKALLECRYAEVARVAITKAKELCEDDETVKAEWVRDLTLLEADACFHEGDYETSLACYKMFEYDFSADGPLLVKYLKTLFKAGTWPDIAAAVFTTGPAPLSIIQNDAQRATLLFDAALWCRADGR